MKLWLKNINLSDIYNINRYIILFLELTVYIIIGYFLFESKYMFHSELLLLPVIGASFYAGTVGALSASTVSIALLLLINPGEINFIQIFVFLVVAIHGGVTTDILKGQITKYRLQAQNLAVKTVALEEKTKTVTALREIDTNILLGSQLTNTLKLIARSICQMTEAKACLVYLKESDDFSHSCGYGIPKDYHDSGICKKVAEETALLKKPVIIQDCKSDKRTSAHASLSDEISFNAAMAAPMVLEENPIGSIILLFEHKKLITDKKIDELMTFVNQATIAFQTEQLVKNLSSLSLETIQTLVKAVEARDPYTAGHSDRVTKYALAIAKEMKLNQKEQELMRYAALLHDIGKLGVDETIVNKPGPLTDKEFEEMRNHVILSDIIIKPIKFLEPVRTWVYYHQEKYDGSGYPEGIKGNKIPLGARILAVADSYEAMTANRPYRDAMTPLDAIDELKKNKGSQFDPKVVKAFLKIFEKEVE